MKQIIAEMIKNSINDAFSKQDQEILDLILEKININNTIVIEKISDCDFERVLKYLKQTRINYLKHFQYLGGNLSLSMDYIVEKYSISSNRIIIEFGKWFIETVKFIQMYGENIFFDFYSESIFAHSEFNKNTQVKLLKPRMNIEQYVEIFNNIFKHCREDNCIVADNFIQSWNELYEKINIPVKERSKFKKYCLDNNIISIFMIDNGETKKTRMYANPMYFRNDDYADAVCGWIFKDELYKNGFINKIELNYLNSFF